ncbi:MAG: hypothetical protein HQ572_02340 [Candidatus Omnitrophica bacterium]|nr:hypothetical protein [Candidatus Omnitrophota bacterium]
MKRNALIGLIVAAMLIAPAISVCSAETSSSYVPPYFTVKDVDGQYDFFLYLNTGPDGQGKGKWIYGKMRCYGYFNRGWFRVVINDCSDADTVDPNDIGKSARGTYTINANGLVEFNGVRGDGEQIHVVGRMNLGKDTITGHWESSGDVGIYHLVKRLG